MIAVRDVLSEDLYSQFVEYATAFSALHMPAFLKTNWSVDLRKNYVKREATIRNTTGQHITRHYNEGIEKAVQDKIYASLFSFIKELWPLYTKAGKDLIDTEFNIGTIKAEFQIVNPKQVFHKHKHSTELNSSVYLWPNEAKGTVFYDPDFTVEWKPNSAMIFQNEWHSFQNDSEEDRRFTINTFIGAK